MTENTTPEEQTDIIAPETLEETPQPVEEQPEPTDKPSREAAKYRRQLREVEAERDQLREQLTTARHGNLDSYIEKALPVGDRGRTATLRNPSDLYAISGLSRDDFLTDTGDLDTGLIAMTARELYDTRRDLFVQTIEPVPASGTGTGSGGAPASFADAFAPR